MEAKRISQRVCLTFLLKAQKQLLTTKSFPFEEKKEKLNKSIKVSYLLIKTPEIKHMQTNTNRCQQATNILRTLGKKSHLFKLINYS